MPFVCPDCAHRSLKIALKIELRPDSRSDEIALQVVECSRCGFAGIAVYEESRRGALDSEHFDHVGYYVGDEDLAHARKIIRGCPDPGNKRCRCSAHRTLGRRDASGRWNGLDLFHRQGSFALTL